MPNSIAAFLEFLFNPHIWEGGRNLLSITVYIRFSKNQSN